MIKTQAPTRYDVNSIIEDISTISQLITIRHDLDTIALILQQTLDRCHSRGIMILHLERQLTF